MTVPRSISIRASSSPAETGRQVWLCQQVLLGRQRPDTIPCSSLGRNGNSPGNIARPYPLERGTKSSQGEPPAKPVCCSSAWLGCSLEVSHLALGIIRVHLYTETELGQQRKMFCSNFFC